ncbi:MAG: DUF6134 family protein [Alphaproteobacteria bacterium]
MSLKKYLLAAVLIGGCVGGIAHAQQPLDLRYQMTFNGKRMGQQSFRIATLPDGQNSYQVDTTTMIDFSPFPLISVKVNQTTQEIWKNGNIATFSSSTNERGDDFGVKAASNGQGIQVEGTEKGKQKVNATLPSDAVPRSWWLESLFMPRKQGFDVKRGKAEPVAASLVGEEMADYHGQQIKVRHYKETKGDGDTGNDKDLYYLETGILYKLAYQEQGNKIIHLLQ